MSAFFLPSNIKKIAQCILSNKLKKNVENMIQIKIHICKLIFNFFLIAKRFNRHSICITLNFLQIN